MILLFAILLCKVLLCLYSASWLSLWIGVLCESPDEAFLGNT